MFLNCMCTFISVVIASLRQNYTVKTIVAKSWINLSTFLAHPAMLLVESNEDLTYHYK